LPPPPIWIRGITCIICTMSTSTSSTTITWRISHRHHPRGVWEGRIGEEIHP
jgi:hypothetical protein